MAEIEKTIIEPMAAVGLANAGTSPQYSLSELAKALSAYKAYERKQAFRMFWKSGAAARLVRHNKRRLVHAGR